MATVTALGYPCSSQGLKTGVIQMRNMVIASILAAGFVASGCDTGPKPQSQGQAKPDEKTIDIVKTQRDALEKAKTVQGTADAVAADRDKALEKSEGK